MFKNFQRLIRLKVTLQVGLSAFAGACLFSSLMSLRHFIGVLIAICLSAGCSAFNQVQEQKEDKLMSRTADRPVASGSLNSKDAILLGTLFFIVSFVLALSTGSKSLLFLSVFSVLIYNLIYTPMKKKTAFALMIGSVSGAIPPYIGYTAMGGDPFNIRIIAVAAVLYVWQTPHFALLSEKYATDYAKAGFKTLSGTYGKIKAQKFIDIWTGAYICSLFFIPLAWIYNQGSSLYIHTALTIGTFYCFMRFRKNNHKAFIMMNISIALFFVLLIVDRLITAYFRF
jgi:protoheme IX farnesyltransferase